MSKERIQSGKPFSLIGQFGMFYFDRTDCAICYYSGDLKGQWYADVVWWGRTHVKTITATKVVLFNYSDCRL